MTRTHPPIILASSSSTRQTLLARLGLSFSCHAPNIDESPLANELPADIAARLAYQKAEVIVTQHPSALVIASDQVAALQQGTQVQLLGKPLTEDNAVQQLLQCQGQRVDFYTALCVYDPKLKQYHQHIDTTHVFFKTLPPAQLRYYIQQEQPLYAAGSFLMEGLGICLFDNIENTDPTALMGLPLIALCHILDTLNCSPLQYFA